MAGTGLYGIAGGKKCAATATNIIVTATAVPGNRYHPFPSTGTSAPGGGSRKLSFNIGKMEHADLVAEMAQVEHLSTQDRLHLARMAELWLRPLTRADASQPVKRAYVGRSFVLSW
uniref:Uncharacterized protein n=1 Tax=Anopheles culicifacies TaxID=139723 RepID=A0A182MIS8_9DIPT